MPEIRKDEYLILDRSKYTRPGEPLEMDSGTSFVPQVRHHLLTRLFGGGSLFVGIGVPIAWVIGYSLWQSFGDSIKSLPGDFVSPWMTAASSPAFGKSLLYTPLLAFGSTGMAVVISLSMVMFFPEWRHSRSINGVCGLMLGVPAAVLSFIVYQVLSPSGVLARIAYLGDLIDGPQEFPAWVNDRWSIGILVAQTVASLPILSLFFFRTWTACRLDAYCLLAESLGASRWQGRIHAALPRLWEQGRSVVWIVFLFQLGSYEIPLLLGSQSPQMFSVLIQRHLTGYDLTQRSLAYVGATLYFGLVLLVLCRLVFRSRRDA